NVDLDNIDEVMTSLAPRATFQVENMLTEEKGSLAINLTFNGMQDFRPENVVLQVNPLRKLVEARERLTDLRNKISNNERLEDLLDEVLQNTDQVRKLSAEAEHE
ncbi:MAG: type VI secretion system contractile sheath small subunit, partial [Acinetobacter sp.]